LYAAYQDKAMRHGVSKADASLVGIAVAQLGFVRVHKGNAI
jgi:hypothetical protein